MIDLGILDLGPHGGYILASYAVAGLILGWMIGASWLANRAAARRLAVIEQQESKISGKPR